MAARRIRGKRPERRFTVEGVRREQPDLRKLGKALLAVVLAEQKRTAEADTSSERSTG
ncbi:hypothetical protein [Streptomyces sp. NPDC094466]|uniref:hypothetical protein n=1 Tax=Streptomyces sp. NPDC094466 TaxID=3366065 RepID=UPI003814DB70